MEVISRELKGNGWTAQFFKRKCNTIMIEDMWSALQPDMSFKEVRNIINIMSIGYGSIKPTVNIDKCNKSVTIKCLDISLPSILIFKN